MINSFLTNFYDTLKEYLSKSALIDLVKMIIKGLPHQDAKNLIEYLVEYIKQQQDVINSDDFEEKYVNRSNKGYGDDL